MLIGTWLNAAGSIIRCFSVLPMFGVSGRFVVLMIGERILKFEIIIIDWKF
jgi:hypothetical protein